MKRAARPMGTTYCFLIFLACTAWVSSLRGMDLGGVLTDPQGKPVAGATIDLLDVHTDPDAWPGTPITQKLLASAAGKADGTFNMDVPIPAEHGDVLCLRAVAPGMGYCMISVSPDFPADQRFGGGPQQGRMSRPWFVMLPGHTIRGTVVDEGGKPVVGCAVRPGMGWDTVRTDAAGKFEIEHFTDLAGTPFADSRQIQFEHTAYMHRQLWLRSEQFTVRQPDGTWRIVLRAGVLVKGHVLDVDSGKPVAGAQVTFQGSTGQTRSNAAGEYAVRVPGDTDMPIFGRRTDSNPSYQPVESQRRQQFPAGTPVVEGFDFHYRASGLGAVPSTPARPQPLSVARGLHITLFKPDGTPAGLGYVRTGPNPEFADLEGHVISVNGRDKRAIFASDYSGEFAGALKLPANVDTNTPIVIKLEPTGRLSGRVYDQGGKPVPDHHINISYSSHDLGGFVIGTAWTDADGRYSITGVVSLDPADAIFVGAAQNISHAIAGLRSGQTITGLNFRIMPPGTPYPESVVPERE